MTGTVFWLPAVALIVVVAACVLACLVNSSPANRYAHLRLQRRMEGASASEFDNEITLRTTAAEFRRLVSLAVLERPAECEKIIQAMAKDEALVLAATDKAVARTFLEWVEGADLAEILHPVAAKAAYRAARSPVSGNVGLVAAGLIVR